MSGAHQSGPQANWVPGATNIKMPPGPTVNLSAVSATLTGGSGTTPPGYSSTSSPFARDSSTRSSPYISRTGSGVSDGSAPTAAAHAHTGGMGGGHPSSDYAAAALQALSQQGGMAAVAAAVAAGSPNGSRSASPASANTPRLAQHPGRSNLGPQAQAAADPLSIEATLQGLTITGAISSPAVSGPVLNFHAPPSGALPQQPPVEVFAKFPQHEGGASAAGPSGRTGGRQGPRGGAHGSHFSATSAYGPAASAAMTNTTYSPSSRHHSHSHGHGHGHNSSYMPAAAMHAPHQPAFFVGSPPGGYGVPMYTPGATAAVPAIPATASFPTAAYYPQAMTPGQQQPTAAYMVPHPYYGMIPAQPFPTPTAYAVYPAHHPPHHPAAAAAAAAASGMVPGGAGRGGSTAGGAGVPGSAGKGGGYQDAAEFQARQYQAMMSYMQHGFGVMVSPSGSPERMGRTSSQSSFRRQERREDSGRQRLGSRPSRLSLDMSASKSENGDAHKLDPELAPLVAEDKSELQSELLEEYKATREARQWTLQDLKGHLYPFCRDQHGSRLVQQQLEAVDQALLSELFAEVRHKLLPLMVDVFGNYVVQRFLERGGIDVQQAVVEAIRGRALPLSLQMYGCRVVQKALEVLPQEERVSICLELTEHTLRCVRDQNGNHVVQKCIECVQPSDPARTMIETIVNKVQSLSTHTFGCRLVQRVLEFCSIPELRERVVSDVLGNSLHLAHDQYGNYVVQHLVIKGPGPARDAIVSKASPQVMTLAQHKYASNVVEACLKHGLQQHRDAIVDQMVHEASARPATLTALMRDQFGNYVVQRALEVATPQQRAALLQIIQPHLEQLKKYTYGKHIVNKVEQMLAAQQQQQAEGEGVAQKAPEAPEAPAPAGPEEAAGEGGSVPSTAE